MPNPLRLFYMAVWRNILTLTRYKANFIFEILTSVLFGFGMLILAVAFDTNLLGNMIGSTNYVAFIILGISYQSWQGIALWEAANMFRNELNTGQIDYTFTCPFSRYFYIVCNIAASAVQSTIFFLPLFCVGLYFTMETVTPLGLLLGLSATLISVAALAQLGAIFASLVLRYREVTAIFGFFNFAFQMLTGMFVPFQLLPLPLQIIGYCLPITFGMDLMRHYLMKTIPIMPVTYEWIVLLVELVVLALIAKLAVLYLEKTAKEQGLHYL
ncbi:ABC transporter permease [Candidatus Bathyarchaeota archaeon]|nr:MAG: ABC transporter permease [Candidatus Bathyarchaeota archaeon]